MQKNIEEKQYLVSGVPIIVRLRKVRGAKGIRIKISSGDLAVVTGNTRTSFRALEDFFLLHRAWAENKFQHFRQFPNPTIQLSQTTYQQKKEPARKQVLTKLALWNQYYGLAWSRVTIRNQSTRWGSCSSRGTLSFHAGILDLPEELQDYLIVHELCHLQAMNHGIRFWKLVEKALPDAKELDRRLKKYTQASIL